MKQNLIINLIITMILLVVGFSPVVTVAATYDSDVVYLPKNQMYNTGELKERTPSFSYVHFKCNSVYPPSGWDTYTKLQARIANSHYIGISNIGTYTEGEDYEVIYIKQGYLSDTTICMQVRGNNPDKDAYATYTYQIH